MITKVSRAEAMAMLRAHYDSVMGKYVHTLMYPNEDGTVSILWICHVCGGESYDTDCHHRDCVVVR